MPIELLYFANPMCSWCWGFAPVIRELQNRHSALRLTVATGRLGADDHRPMRDKDKQAVGEHWRQVNELTGQPFEHSFLERDGFVYDTAPACRAVAILRGGYPALTGLFLHRLHERFYALGQDVTDPDVLADAAAEFGMDHDSFRRSLAEPEIAAIVQREWTQTAALGVTGYPTLLGLKDGKAEALAVGWRPLAEIVAALSRLRAA